MDASTLRDAPRPNERVLVFGDDGSPAADVAWLWVCNHRWPGWRVDVITAVEPAPSERWGHHATPVEWESPHPRLLAAHSMLERVRSFSVAADARLALGEQTEADLLVIGPGRVRHLHAVPVGSTAEWLLQYPSVPMAIIRSATPITTVMALVDGSAHSRVALEAFASLPWATQAQVEVVGVTDRHTTPDQAVADAVASLTAAGISATATLLEGRVTPVIMQHIDLYEPQLVVLGTRGLNPWSRLRIGSTAMHVVRGAPCSTLVASTPVEDATG